MPIQFTIFPYLIYTKADPKHVHDFIRLLSADPLLQAILSLARPCPDLTACYNSQCTPLFQSEYAADTSRMAPIPLVRLSILCLIPTICTRAPAKDAYPTYILCLRLYACVSRLIDVAVSTSMLRVRRLIRFALSLPPMRIPSGFSTGVPYVCPFPSTNTAAFPHRLLIDPDVEPILI